MRAVVIYNHGGLDQMVFEQRYRDPVPGPGDVLLRVRACTLNYHDVFTRKACPASRSHADHSRHRRLVGGVKGISVGQRVLVDPIDRVDGRLLGETFDGRSPSWCVPAHMIIPLPTRWVFSMLQPCRSPMGRPTA